MYTPDELKKRKSEFRAKRKGNVLNHKAQAKPSLPEEEKSGG